MTRTILCVDLDAFFVSVERRLDPSLAGRPVVVGYPGGRGVVTAASYEARAFGVRSAMPTAEAEKRLRGVEGVAWIAPSRGAYEEASAEVRAVLESELPVVLAASIDEFYADATDLLTGRRAGLYEGGVRGHEADPLLIARHVARKVERECRLPASVGIAASRLLAKMATDEAKPRGALWVRPGHEAAFLEALPVEKIPGVGVKTAPRLHAAGVREIGDIRRIGREALGGALGEHMAAWLEGAARGVDPTPVTSGEEARSIGHEETFEEDVSSEAALLAIATDLADRVAYRLRAEGLRARTVQVKLRYAARRGRWIPGRIARDVFETVTRAVTGEATDDGREVAERARALLREHWRAGEALRLLGVSARGLEERGRPRERQTDLFAPEPPAPARAEGVTRALDAIRGRFGFEAIAWGSAVRPPECREG